MTRIRGIHDDFVIVPFEADLHEIVRSVCAIVASGPLPLDLPYIYHGAILA